MDSHDTCVDSVASREESMEAIEGSVAPTSASRVGIGHKGVGLNAPISLDSVLAAGLLPEYAQILQMAF
ncbi:UNVERIFIED_CONTAM: hypothetical protein Sangu_1693600 [Sesamum angustifolium]|uniref:Uncharacterized protein n=1 Tax=Sesamum angustifolium TaxID=2727405 RepID=A0AAW2MMT5_9LAMI